MDNRAISDDHGVGVSMLWPGRAQLWPAQVATGGSWQWPRSPRTHSGLSHGGRGWWGIRLQRAGGGRPPEPPKQSGRGFSAAWQRGFEEIFAIWLVRGRADHRQRLGRRPATLARWLGLAYWPPLVSLILPLGAEPGRRAVLLLLLGTINAGMFAAGALAWRYALTRANTIDDLLRPCPNRESVPNIIHRAVSLRWQATLPALFALMPWMSSPVTGAPLWSEGASIVLGINLTWTMALLGNVSYWLIVPPLLVITCGAVERTIKPGA